VNASGLQAYIDRNIREMQDLGAVEGQCGDCGSLHCLIAPDGLRSFCASCAWRG
jgi:hypothetical protein